MLGLRVKAVLLTAAALAAAKLWGPPPVQAIISGAEQASIRCAGKVLDEVRRSDLTPASLALPAEDDKGTKK